MSVYKQQRNNITKTWILMFVFISLITIICYVLSLVYGNYSIAVFGFLVSLFQSGVGYFFGDKIALSSVGAKQVKAGEATQIEEMVYNLAKVAQIPNPKIYISPDKSANAFACGRNPKNASICLNQGILDILDKNELEGVIAHELSHIKNRDILIMTMTMVLSSVISFIVDFAFRMSFFGGFSSKDSDGNNKSPLVFILYIVLLIAAPILSLLISMAVSRQREFLADATAVTLTRYPNGLINALQKLYKNPIPTDHYSTAMNHFYISPPKKEFGKSVSNLFSTHPNIESRVKALRGM
jgi:heat shock protein HtpX